MVRFLIALSVLLLVLPACSSSALDREAPENWLRYSVADGPPRADMLAACRWALNDAGFPPGEVDLVSGEVISGWDNKLHVFSGKGTRQQAVLRVEKGDRPEAWLVWIQVLVQANQEIHRPYEIQEADWEDAGFDRKRARIIQEHLRIRVEPIPRR
ncbi:MAG: hypothetical protein DWQ01_13810 [Planctomycetota bacterium]|nr:MAG: hypothetical protein DWQ01_13810 [Planctomycetota bacterium]